jgi:tetratricopeptide (TPR) repeat protein
LGIALSKQSRYKEAEAAFREAIGLDPDSREVYYQLADALHSQGRDKAAEAALREAISRWPGDALAHFSLGGVLCAQGRYKEGEAVCREAIRSWPDLAEAHCNLGHNLRNQGRFAEALEALRRGHELGSKTPDWSYPSFMWVSTCERLAEWDGQLHALVKVGTGPASPAGRLELAFFSREYRQCHVAAVNLYSDAFKADPKLAEDLAVQDRYCAAISAALAAAGQGEDAQLLPDRVIVTLRRQALHWLQADLALYARLAEHQDPAGGLAMQYPPGQPRGFVDRFIVVTITSCTVKEVVQPHLARWQKDANLASVRDKEALDRLPEDEREAWRQLWADVAGLLKKVEERPR